MPIYEYQCNVCREEFERLVLAGEDKSRVGCPACRSKDVRKKMSASSFMSTRSIGTCAAGAPKDIP